MAFLLQIALTHQTQHARPVPVCLGWLQAAPARTVDSICRRRHEYGHARDRPDETSRQWPDS